MPGAARLGDSILGETVEHSGHIPPHEGILEITGTIYSNCSSNVFINGMAAAFVGSITEEKDACCGTSYGSIAQGSSSVFINGKAAAYNGSMLNAHSGEAHVSSGSSNVIIAS